MLKCDVKEVKTGRFSDVIVMKWPYTHPRGSSDPVLNDFQFTKILVFQSSFS